MYDKTIKTLVSYIKLAINGLEVFDSQFEFKEPDNYSSIFILNIIPVSPHENCLGQEQLNENIKLFKYKETNYINAKINFRGENASENMSFFKNSFVKETQQELLKKNEFGYLGLTSISPLISLRDSKSKFGMTSTLKLIGSKLITDESQIIRETKVNVSTI